MMQLAAGKCVLHISDLPAASSNTLPITHYWTGTLTHSEATEQSYTSDVTMQDDIKSHKADDFGLEEENNLNKM